MDLAIGNILCFGSSFVLFVIMAIVIYGYFSQPREE